MLQCVQVLQPVSERRGRPGTACIRNVVPGLAGEALQSEGAAGVEGETRQVSHEAARSGSVKGHIALRDGPGVYAAAEALLFLRFT